MFPESEQKVLVRFHIDTGPGRRDEDMVIYRGQEHQAEKFAHNLCVKHGFDKKIKAALADRI